MSVILRKRKLKRGDWTLFLDYYQPGQPRRFEKLDFKLKGDSTDKELIEMAKAIRAKRELEYQSNNYELPAFRKDISFFEYAENHMKRMNVHPNYIGNIKNSLDYLKQITAPSITFNQINYSLCEKFIDLLYNKVSPNTACSYFLKFKSILNTAIKDGIINKNPATGIKLKGKETLPKFLIKEEVKKLIDTPCSNQNVKNGFLLACFTGLRFADVEKICWSDIDFISKRMRIIEKKTGNANLQPLSIPAIQILDIQRGLNGNDDKIFIMPTNKILYTTLKHWATKAGVNKNLTFHCGRHTFATMLITYGSDVYTVSKLLGHKSLRSTTVYAKVIDSKKEEAVSFLPATFLG